MPLELKTFLAFKKKNIILINCLYLQIEYNLSLIPIIKKSSLKIATDNKFNGKTRDLIFFSKNKNLILIFKIINTYSFLKKHLIKIILLIRLGRALRASSLLCYLQAHPYRMWVHFKSENFFQYMSLFNLLWYSTTFLFNVDNSNIIYFKNK